MSTAVGLDGSHRRGFGLDDRSERHSRVEVTLSEIDA